jgi:hypothetical protein
MKSQLISDDYDRPAATNQKSFVIIFDDGDEVVAGLKKFAGEHDSQPAILPPSARSKK